MPDVMYAPAISYRIWDMHCHLPSSRVAGESLTEQMGRTLEIAERVDIDKLCVYLRTDRDDGPSNEEIRGALEKYHGRIFGFVWIDLEETQQALDTINRWIADGPMIGIKLGGGSGIYSKPEYDVVFERGVEIEAVFYMHTWIKLGGDPPYPGGGNLPKESTPTDVVEVARRYSDYPFICGHNGGDWQRGTRIAAPQENVYIEISGGYPERGQVEMAVREVGADRVVYGSDITGRSFSSQLGKVLDADISDAERQIIFADNFARLAAPQLARKGIDLTW